MGRLAIIEDLVAGQLNSFMNLKLFVRGRPKYLDPQLDRGTSRFALRRGFNFTAILPDNKYLLAEDAAKDDTRVVMESRPGWIQPNCLVRVGLSEEIGELHVVNDLISTTTLDLREPLIQSYVANTDPAIYVSLYGTPLLFYAVGAVPRHIIFLDSWYRMVPGDTLLASPDPDSPETLVEYKVRRANFVGTRAGIGSEPAVIYRYEVELATDSGLIGFDPILGMKAYLKPLPMYERGAEFASGDMKIPSDMGPFLVDAYSGALLISSKVETVLGIKTWDSFGAQQNAALTGDQQWQVVPKNYLILERPIRSDSFLFWQRIKGTFQYVKAGFFQAELDENGEFVMSTDLLVPRWPSDRQHGWVIPLVPQAPTSVSVQFDPQERQVFDLPASTLSFVRPKLFVDPERRDVTRVVFSLRGAPNSRVEIRTWEYDGQAVQSLSYFMLGDLEAFGQNRWLAGGFNLKPLFYNLDILKARYSDGVSRYNAGYIYV